MAELEKNPQALRQGAASLACVALAAAAMPAISHRAAAQRADAQWAARAAAMQQALAQVSAGAPDSGAEAVQVADVQFAAYRTEGGFLLHGRGAEFDRASLEEAHALTVRIAAAEPRGAMSASEVAAVYAGLADRSALATLQPFEPMMLNVARNTAAERRCLSEAIYYEARGESFLGQAAVAEVVLNRVRSPHYPDTVCDVVYEGSYRATGCQFTFTCDGSLRRKPYGEAWDRAQKVAMQAMMGLTRPLTHRATHYHTDEINPYWSASLIETTRIGAHVFYRFPNRRERAVLAAARTPAPAVEPASALYEEVAFAPEPVIPPDPLGERVVGVLPAALDAAIG